MTREQFDDIMNSDISTQFPEGDNAIAGLQIIIKYLPKSGIEGADHDIIYSCDVEELVEAGITEEDTRQLREWNWMIQDGYLACFV